MCLREAWALTQPRLSRCDGARAGEPKLPTGSFHRCCSFHRPSWWSRRLLRALSLFAVLPSLRLPLPCLSPLALLSRLPLLPALPMLLALLAQLLLHAPQLGTQRALPLAQIVARRRVWRYLSCSFSLALSRLRSFSRALSRRSYLSFGLWRYVQRRSVTRLTTRLMLSCWLLELLRCSFLLLRWILQACRSLLLCICRRLCHASCVGSDWRSRGGRLLWHARDHCG